MKNTVSYDTITNTDQQISKEKSNLYIDSYGNDPYRREGWSDSSGAYLTLQEYDKEKALGRAMLDYQRVYTQESLLEIFSKQTQKSTYTEIQALSEQALVGVIYGYADNQEGLQKKLGVSDTDYVDIQQVVGKASSTSYLTELFVGSTARGRGISSALLDQYIALQSKKGLSGILTRTTTMKPYPMSSFLKRGFEQIYTYPTYDPRKRALFYKPL